MLRKLAPVALLVAVIVMAVHLAVGWPDVSEAGAFLGGGFPTPAAAGAVAGVFIWAIVAVAGLVLLRVALRRVEDRQRVMRQRWIGAMLVLCAGLFICGLGIAHHYSRGPTICCGSIQEALDVAK